MRPLPGSRRKPSSAQKHLRSKTAITKNSKPKESVPMPQPKRSSSCSTKMALHELVQNYCRAVDRRDYALLESLTTPIRSTITPRCFKGSGPEFVRWVPSSVERFELTQHVIASASFVRRRHDRGRRMFHRCVSFAQERAPAGDDRPCRYLDRYEKRDGVWRILYRKIIYDWSEVRPYDKELFAKISRVRPRRVPTKTIRSIPN